MVQKRKLNRGLEALLGSGVIPKPQPESVNDGGAGSNPGEAVPVAELPIEHLQRGMYQPRRDFDAEALDTLAEGPGDPCEAVTLSFCDPLTGGPTLPTLGCEMTLLRGHEKTCPHRHTAAAVYHAFEGEGFVTIGEERIAFQTGDSFVVPSWAWHSLENTGTAPALLFSINDGPVMQALGFSREERESGQ